MINSSILSSENSRYFFELLFQTVDGRNKDLPIEVILKGAIPKTKIPEKELLKALNLLRSNYEIKKYPVTDHIQFNDWNISHQKIVFTPYIKLKKVHAGNVYIQLVATLIFQSAQKKNENIKKEFIENIEFQVKRLEDQLKKYQKYSDDIAHEFYYYTNIVLKFLFLLFQFYESNQRNYVKAFYKFYKYLTKHNDIVPHKKILWPMEYASYGNTTSDFFNQIIGPSKIFSDGFEMFGNNKELRDAYVTALMSADDPYPLLILGETGTGKEIITKTIHEFSSRRENNFQILNLAAVPETLFDSEISGALKGAATNILSRLGLFLSACGNTNLGYQISNGKMVFKVTDKKQKNEPSQEELKKIGGTAFLDEINSIPTYIQAKLLRIIEENEVKVLGEDRVRKFNVKIICASNVNLEEKVKLDEFRQDLYYRISGQVITLPPLRDMKESIIPIAEKQILKIKKNIDFNKTISISKAARKKMMGYDWPGNIRELHNILYRAMSKLRLEERLTITGTDITFPSAFNRPIDNISADLADMKHAELEKKYITAVMKKAGGNISKAKIIAGFNSRSSIRRLLKMLDEENN
jgi:DNA-binding NtrC family response regulator